MLNGAPAKNSAASRTLDAMERMPALSERNGTALRHSRSTFRVEGAPNAHRRFSSAAKRVREIRAERQLLSERRAEAAD